MSELQDDVQMLTYYAIICIKKKKNGSPSIIRPVTPGGTEIDNSNSPTADISSDPVTSSGDTSVADAIANIPWTNPFSDNDNIHRRYK
uniref:Uncharacterized protein n=1 Tax=Strongyloides papillosus TaxID=174720 RepID=A0A0N5C9M1_STREA